jgi:hypothetical protein
MPTKQTILQSLTHKELLEIATLSSVETTTTPDVVAVDRGSSKTVLREVLRRYSIDRLKQLCVAAGVDDFGKDKDALLERLLWTGASSSVTGEALTWIAPSAGTAAVPRRKSSSVEIAAINDRRALAIKFPNLVGFTLAKEALRCNVDKIARLTIAPRQKPTADLVWTANGFREATPEDKGKTYPDRVSSKKFYEERPLDNSINWLAAYIVEILAGGHVQMEHQPTSTLRPKGPRLLSADVRAIVEDYIDRRVTVARGARIEDVALGCNRNGTLERLVSAIELDVDAGQPMLLPVLDETRPSFSTADVRFSTKRPSYETRKSHISHVVIDGEWGSSAADMLEQSPKVVAYVKNDQPHFGIQYEWNSTTHKYLPDFLVRIAGAIWIVEVDRPPSDDDDARWRATAKWVTAMNNHGGFGLWKHVICRDAKVLRSLIAYPAPIDHDGSEVTTGKPQRCENDFEWWERHRQASYERRKRRPTHWRATMCLTVPGVPPLLGQPSRRKRESTKEPKQEWAVPCRCGTWFCDGVRYVSFTPGEFATLVVGAHLWDPANLLMKELPDSQLEELAAAIRANGLPSPDPPRVSLPAVPTTPENAGPTKPPRRKPKPRGGRRGRR